MKNTKVVPLRIPEKLEQVAALRAEIEHTDRATAMRQWLHEGADRYVVQLVSDGHITISRAAELLDVSIYDIHAMAERYGIQLGPTVEQWHRSLETLERLIAETKAESRTQ
jgi:hypothetical protein